MKLIYHQIIGGSLEIKSYTVPFQYESKEKFISDVTEKYKKEFPENLNPFDQIEIFYDIYLTKFDVETLDLNVYTFEELYIKHKSIPKL